MTKPDSPLTLGTGGKTIACKQNVGARDCAVGAGARQSYGPKLTRDEYIASLQRTFKDAAGDPISVDSATKLFIATYGDVQTIPTFDHAGPSIQSAPVQSRVMAVFGWTYASNDGSMEMMSGSLK